VTRVGPLWIGVLALWVGILSGILWFWSGDKLAPALLSGAAVGIGGIALAQALNPPQAPVRRVIAMSSASTVVVAFGLAMTLNGLAFGLWLILIGAEVTAFGLFGLVRELISSRRAREAAR
jgi:hypothetical protein